MSSVNLAKPPLGDTNLRCVGYSSMEHQDADPSELTVGQRVIAALIPRYFKNLTELSQKSGLAYSTVHDWKMGNGNPRMDTVQELVRLVNELHHVSVRTVELLNGGPLAEFPATPREQALYAFRLDPDPVATEAVRRVEGAKHFGAGRTLEWWTRRVLREIELVREEIEDSAGVEARSNAEKTRLLEAPAKPKKTPKS